MENYENVGLFEKDSLISTYADEIAGISHFMNFSIFFLCWSSHLNPFTEVCLNWTALVATISML